MNKKSFWFKISRAIKDFIHSFIINKKKYARGVCNEVKASKILKENRDLQVLFLKPPLEQQRGSGCRFQSHGESRRPMRDSAERSYNRAVGVAAPHVRGNIKTPPKPGTASWSIRPTARAEIMSSDSGQRLPEGQMEQSDRMPPLTVTASHVWWW